ncbi:ATP synthase F1, epsilon subunit [Oceaniovalibus guishaninsula JLT2003]|uniref:ATP synthase epsilon chain n=1 Tax=Oceaniovalibus guishaninsula JLT2003 TaxID=1231392 RepID=K2GT32_9RHOB|nr:F0F1 ATP synthase subunit epsilon [Oceaniovalibus guishaninsula]EKE45691.1 ATP synthase F1, epsilon subunit [Oceaniovalibus guishaninsula JLT2003]
MAETMQFNLVSPERNVASYQATSVQIPGAEGDMTAMADHAPTITTLRPGILRVEGPEGVREYVVTGGFAEIGEHGVSVLAEQGMPREDVTQEHYDRMVEDASRAHEKARETFRNEPGPVDDAAKLLADMVAVGTHIGLSSKQPNL